MLLADTSREDKPLSETQKIRQILKNRSAVGLTRQLLNVPPGGKTVTVQSAGQTVRLFATTAKSSLPQKGTGSAEPAK